MIDRPLSGSDVFHLLIDRKMLRNGLVGNISRIHYRLEASADLDRIAQRLRQNDSLRTVTGLIVQHHWSRPATWSTRAVVHDPVAVHLGISKAHFDKKVKNRKVDNADGLVFIDLCELENGTKHVVISMHHVLFDNQGMVNFTRALSGGSVVHPVFPSHPSRPLVAQVHNTITTTIHLLRNACWRLGTLVDERVVVVAPPRYLTIRFSKTETALIEERARGSGARISQNVFHIAALAGALLMLLQKRGKAPPYLWFSVPHDQRRKGSVGHLVSNQLSYLFFKLNREDLRTVESTVASMNAQLKERITHDRAARYQDLLGSLRLVPMGVYEAMVDLASGGKMSSFGYSDLGTEREPLRHFLGAEVLDKWHYPPCPVPPGLNVVARKENACLNFMWAYVDEALSETELVELERSFRNTLLGVT